MYKSQASFILVKTACNCHSVKIEASSPRIYSKIVQNFNTYIRFNNSHDLMIAYLCITEAKTKIKEFAVSALNKEVLFE